MAATLACRIAALLATALVRTYGLPLTAETITFGISDEILFRSRDRAGLR
jgi:iron(III) transport system permease protein